MSTKDARPFMEKLVGPFTFAMFLRGARTTLDLSQVEMAKRLGISRQTLCDLEKGRQLVRPELASKYAKRIGFSEVLALEACFQDQLRKANIKKRVRIEDAA